MGIATEPVEPVDHAEHSPVEIRASLEAPIYAHASEGSTNIGKELELEPDVMVSYVIESKRLSLDLEVGEAILLHTDEEGVDTPKRTGTVLRPGVAYKPAADVPVFVTAMLPMHLEPSPFVFGLRLGAGIDFHIPVGKYFIEADVDFPLAGASGAPDAFKTQTLSLATGVLFHLPK